MSSSSEREESCYVNSQAFVEDGEVQRVEGDPHGRFRRRKQEGVHSRIDQPRPFVCTGALVDCDACLSILKCETCIKIYKLCFMPVIP